MGVYGEEGFEVQIENAEHDVDPMLVVAAQTDIVRVIVLRLVEGAIFRDAISGMLLRAVHLNSRGAQIL